MERTERGRMELPTSGVEATLSTGGDVPLVIIDPAPDMYVFYGSRGRRVNVAVRPLREDP